MKLVKYHGLGNDYLVLDARQHKQISEAQIKLVCHRNFGLGSDGILQGPFESDKADFGLRIFNPDGSEAEKSGNGLRIFSRYLYDQQLVQLKQPFTIKVLGGIVKSELYMDDEQLLVKIEMGRISFRSKDIPVKGEDREVLAEGITLNNKTYQYYADTIGNPHVVLPMPEVTKELACQLGPLIETHANFPNRTNV